MPQPSEESYHRLVQTSVTNFLYCGDDYLMLKRAPTKRIDPNKLNGIGGRLEQGENYLDAAIRETEEETGYVVTPADIALAGIVKLEGGYAEDWVMAFFRIRVASKQVPKGRQTEDGELMWINKDKVLDSNYKRVDDLNYCFKEIVAAKGIFFLTAKLNESETIYSASITSLPA